MIVSWITLLDSIPELDLLRHLPAFLPGLFRTLSDSADTIRTMTVAVLEDFQAGFKGINDGMLALINARVCVEGCLQEYTVLCAYTWL